MEEKKKSDASVIEVSRVGIRAYARGRAYDPYRYSPDGPTPYKDPGTPVDETAVEKALKKKSDHLQAVAAEGAADQLIVNEILEENAPAEAVETAEESLDTGADAEITALAEDDAEVQDPWAKVDAEVDAINAASEDKDKE